MMIRTAELASPFQSVEPRVRRIRMSNEEFLASWLPDPGVLHLPDVDNVHPGQSLALRMMVPGHAGQFVSSTLFGIAVSTRRKRIEALSGTELLLERMSLPAADFLARVCRG